MTKADRRLACVKSENGKGTTITSPFTNSAMLHPPLILTSLFPKKIHSAGLLLTYLYHILL
jgi:hypothetical protein